MHQEDINELHHLIENFLEEKGYKQSNLISFLSVQYMGTMALYGYSPEFFNKTIERMKDHYPHYLKNILNAQKKINSR